MVPSSPPGSSRSEAKRPPRLSRWQAAREVLSSRLQQLPAPSAAPSPRLGRRGRLVTHSIAAVLIMGVCMVVLLSGKSASQGLPASATTTPRATPTTPVPVTVTGSASVGALLEQQAAAFLAAYFSWDARDTDTTYARRWQPYAAPSARPSLIASEPLVTLDNGTDVAAQSPVPAIPAQAIEQQGTASHLVVVWTIQVLPEGGEGAAWHSRQVQASLSLVEQPDGIWLVNTVAWSSQGGTY